MAFSHYFEKHLRGLLSRHPTTHGLYQNIEHPSISLVNNVWKPEITQGALATIKFVDSG